MEPSKRIAGVLAPLFAIRSESDLGIGDTGTLRDFVGWAAEAGFRLVQLLPINETGADNSPYNAVSAFALDPTTIETSPGAIRELSQEDFQETLAGFDITSLRTGPVQYAEVKRLKHALLQKAFHAFKLKLKKKSGRAKKFAAWCAEHRDWLDGYVLFRALMEDAGSEVWSQWPLDRQTLQQASIWLDTLSPEDRATLHDRMMYFSYVQWIAYSQWADVKKFAEARGVALMGDIPIGVSYYSADVFTAPELFDLEWSGGAPPEKVFQSDPFTVKWGQNWGVPVYRWSEHERTCFAWWRKRVSMVREVFHIFRIDHVLGFFRIYAFPWRPERNPEFLNLDEHMAAQATGGRLPRFLPNDDSKWEGREHNRLHGKNILQQLVDVVGDHRLIGEDLGVVPDYVPPTLAALGIAGFKIPMWERLNDGTLVPGASYPRLTVATYATHDHPPLKVLWNDWAAAIAGATNGNHEAMESAHHARSESQALAHFAGLSEECVGAPFSESLRNALLLALFRSNSWLAIVMITDVFGTDDRFNVPGAVADSNWSRRMAQTVSQWADTHETASIQSTIRRLIRLSGRY